MTFRYEIPNSNILANYADTAGPDSSDSPGALFLQRVADVTVDALEWAIEQDEIEPRRALEALVDNGEAHDIADQCVPIYTHERWLTFVDLAAYQEDVVGTYGETNDMTEAAGIALYMIAERVIDAVAEDYVESLEDYLAAEEDREPDEDPNPDPDGSLADQEANRYEDHMRGMAP